METLSVPPYIKNQFLLAMEKDPMAYVSSKAKSGLLQSQALFQTLCPLVTK